MGQDDRRIEIAIENLLLGIGEDVQREGLSETPKRVSRFYSSWMTVGKEPTFNCTTFKSEGIDQMICQTNISFHSLCEHHLLPFFGIATVAYIPYERIVGLSKLARTVEWFARRPQNQERLTQDIVSFLSTKLGTDNVAARLSARHMCMEMRGVKTAGAVTHTVVLNGGFRTDDKLRNEFMLVAGRAEV